MADVAPSTETVEASEAQEEWTDLLARVSRRETRVLVERSGVPVAAIVSADDLRRLLQLDAEQSAELDRALDRMRAAFADVPEDQLERDVAEVIERVRAGQRDQSSAPNSA